ncbi:hypothetical protein SARC_01629 [Sphaeroforma arctica JP610]|uniref:C2H2-type domain-containing protein n=1 Tax=Sphaeroforma arctica JP610 TaxID=667725 RepID=A0A0L0GBD8_9EUKA|nr:hypothetical protein SARC_01629 [Sphaeroforma arctica JP610]KNC86219.1 hypothetical protein SARC_01629 [Sphaeroforma arctica JP610]|eukprot:XP_014160121.1 hypothetical protein SARC_01629 [Sphaeroforma arctica JP610]
MAEIKKRSAEQAIQMASEDAVEKKSKRSKQDKVKDKDFKKDKKDKKSRKKDKKKDKSEVTEIELNVNVGENTTEAGVDAMEQVTQVSVSDSLQSNEKLDEVEEEALRQWEAQQMAEEVQENATEVVKATDKGGKNKKGTNAKKEKGEKKFKGVTCPFRNCTEVFKAMKPHGIYTCTTNEDKKVYACMVKSCPKTFINSKRLRVHFRTHKEKERVLLDCQCYGCVGRTGANAIKTTTIDTTPLEVNNTSVKKLGEDVTCTGTGKVALKCPYKGCEEVFTTLKPHGVYKCTADKKESYNCIVHACGDLFVNTKQLKQHVAKHTYKDKLDCKCHLCLVRSALKEADSAARKPEEETAQSDTVTSKNNAKKEPVKTDLTIKSDDTTTLSDAGAEGVKVECPHTGCEETFALESHRKYRCKTTAKHPVVRVCFVAACGKAFTDNLQMKEHVALDHNKNGKVEDLICDCCSCEKLYADFRLR